MKKPLQLLIIMISAISCLPVLAEQVRQLSWDDLIPSHLLAEDPLADLTQEQQDMAYWVINMLERLPKRGPETEEYYKEVDEAMPILKKSGIDIVEIINRRNEIRTAVVENLNGHDVRIPGYLCKQLVARLECLRDIPRIPAVAASTILHVPFRMNSLVLVDDLDKRSFGSNEPRRLIIRQ